MPLISKFQADFSEFHAACILAETELKSFGEGAASAEARLNKMANSLTGSKLIQDAHLMVEAVDRIGGATSLTRAEQDKVNRSLTEAIAKYEALGGTAPAEMRLLANETRKVDDAIKPVIASTTNWKSALGGIAGALGVSFSAGAIIAFGKHVFDAASDIHDMSEKIGISTDAVQGFKFAAEQAGSSLDTVGTAINKMNSNLAGGDKATVGALRDAGLRFADIRNMKPEDAFLSIADAIQKIPDPMVQSRVAMQLFGKSAAELLPAIKEGFRQASDGASKMSEDTIKSLEAAQDAWGRLVDKVIILSGTLIATTMDAASAVTSSWKNFLMFADTAMRSGIGSAVVMAEGMDRVAKAGKNMDVNLPGPAIHKTKEELDGAAAAAKRYADAFNSMFGKFSGQSATADLKMLDAVLGKLTATGQLTEQRMEAIVKEALNLMEAGGQLTPRLWSLVQAMGAISPPAQQMSIDIGKIGTNFDIVIPKIDEVWKKLNEPIPFGITNLREQIAALVVWTPKASEMAVKVHDVNKALGDLSQAFAQLGQIAGGTLGDIVRALGTVVSSIETANKAMAAFGEGKKAFSAGDTLAGIAGMASGIMGIASAAIAAGSAIAKMFDRNKGRDTVEDFAKTFQTFNLDTMQFNPGGGFNELHKQLGALGAEGERLWIALTQGVGRNNPEQARAVIDLITKALAAQKDATTAVGDAADDAAAKQSDAAKKAQAAVEEMTGKIQSLTDSIKDEAPEEVMGIVEANTRAQIEAITKQRDAAQAAIDDTTASAAEAAKEAGDIIDTELAKRLFHVKVKVDLDGLPNGATWSGGSGGSGTGGLSPGSTINLVMPNGDLLLKHVVGAARDAGLA